MLFIFCVPDAVFKPLPNITVPGLPEPGTGVAAALALALKARAQLLRALPDGDDSDGATPVVVDAKRHAAARVVTPGEGSGDEGDRPGDAEGGGWDAFVCRTHREPPVA